jgi:hypothetical protein
MFAKNVKPSFLVCLAISPWLIVLHHVSLSTEGIRQRLRKINDLQDEIHAIDLELAV